MQAIMYLLRRTYINKLKRSFSSPVSIIITLIAVLSIGSSIVFAFTAKRSGADVKFAETLIAGIVLLIGVILYNSFLSRDSGILTMADANFLFTGPFERRTVLAYLLISTAPASVLTGLMICFYFPYIIGSALTAPKFLVVLLINSLLFACIYLSYYYIYILDIEKPGLKKKVRKVFLAIIGAMAIVFVIVLFNTGFDLKITAQKYFTHYLYNLVPLFGWTKWAISSLIAGNIIYGFIPAAVLLSAVIVFLCLALYNINTDFYEKTLEDSISLQKLLDDKRTNGNVDARSIAKLKDKASAVKFNSGAGAIYSRQQLESNKVGFGTRYREVFMGLIYVAFGLMFSLEFNFVLVMVGFSSLTMSLNDSWHRDFKKPYVFLIPASSFSKLIMSVLPGMVKTLLSGGISIALAGLIYKVNPVNLLSYIFVFASFVVLFIFAEILTYRLIGSGTNVMAVTFMRMLFAMAACIPAVIVLVIITVVSNEMPDLPAIFVSVISTNLVFSILLAYLSRGIFESSEIMD
ncbi:putative ABC exporter [Ruminiclostridium sufflavum DSM 19573]|uniref:Putative ABC exporter n=1 Tax=Ruminiclostridium sufflavum DSM 19573 TaxID=1121337 RepID=A0A318XMF7_9FIRM|nr:putative ABC exporter domain-containing protein [Ruminiclostridium sufflavum]PYG87824.1 putative ABC exporter [Ruminiclostridium sufflavum DSM 19573]